MLGVPTDYTLADLHEILQIGMGWHAYHEYLFRIQGRVYSSNNGKKGADDELMKLSKAFKKSPSGFEYLYHPEANWSHEEKLIETLVPPNEEVSPMSWDGEGACPPEELSCISPENLFAFNRISSPVSPEYADHWEQQRIILPKLKGASLGWALE